jgi:hypothetical protein
MYRGNSGVVYETIMNWTSTVPRKEEMVTENYISGGQPKIKGHLDNLNKDGGYSRKMFYAVHTARNVHYKVIIHCLLRSVQ